MLGQGRLSARTQIETETAERARHETLESVRITSSFARAERLLGGEYHGRFLIELLQNAADAWRQDTRATDGVRSRAAIILTDEPALVVANQGIDLSPETVIESLGHIGASTKAEGEAIGHKGIGFKSVLEITSRPEIYSGLQHRESRLAVRFDPSEAVERIKGSSPDWDAFLQRTAALDLEDPHSAIPTLRYPIWVDDIPPSIEQLAEEGFDTVVRLPFDEQLAARRASTKEKWLSEVRLALGDITDEILLLLGSFSEVTVHNQADDEEVLHIAPGWRERHTPLSGAEVSDVLIQRADRDFSTWRVYRRVIRAKEDLAAEIAVGLRLVSGADGLKVVPAVSGSASTPFHLFFPTRILSGTPFLLHGYFQVNASRTGFHRAAESDNKRILDELAELVRDVVLDLGQDKAVDPTSLVNVMAACPIPEDRLAAGFRDRVLSLLDDENWVPVRPTQSGLAYARPRDLIAGHPRFTRLVSATFPPDYVHTRTERALMRHSLSDAAIDLLASRHTDTRDPWDLLGELCRPGALDVWREEEADDRFLEFLGLVNWLTGEFPECVEKFLGGLRGDPSSRLVPVVSESGGRTLLPVPDPSVGLTGRRSQLVMARIRSRRTGTLVPPEELQVSFLAEGLLTADEINRARPLGIRPFTVDNVLDRLGGLETNQERAEEVLTFVWKFLVRERRNHYGTRKLAERAVAFSPQEWFWCQPGRARESDTRRQEQQRERHLAEVLLPNRKGDWRSANTLGFGQDWAEWLESSADEMAAADQQRCAAYRALDRVCPDPEDLLLASPDIILPLLEEVDLHSADLAGPEDDESLSSEAEHEADEVDWDRERHAFLLRLGVWEVMPVEAFEGRDRREGREHFPWAGEIAERQRRECTSRGGWTFGMGGWSGQQHWNVYLGEDFRLQWPLGDAARRDARAVTDLIDAGLELYTRCMEASFFCPGCSDSGTGHTVMRHSSPADMYPSWVALQLASEAWVPVQVAGEDLPKPVEPGRAWWLERVPGATGMMTSPWRFVPVCGPSTGVGETVRRLGSINTAEDANVQAVHLLLRQVREQFEAGEIDLRKTTDRQAFVSLHTAMYDRLADEAEDAGRTVLKDVGVLSTLGSSLKYTSVDDVRHDDGRFSAYVRHFADHVPLAVIRRDRRSTAERLGIARLNVDLRRGGDDEGRDVTEDLSEVLQPRAPELLAILVHHGVGSQQVTLDSASFRQRAQRLAQLRVYQVTSLAIEASVEGREPLRLGGGSSGDMFLEGATTARPVLYHDFVEDGWRENVRRRLWLHLAAFLEAPGYAHTFALFLQCDSDSEREEFLLELGISQEDVDAVAAQLGLVSEAEQASRKRWFTAVVRVLSSGFDQRAVDGDSVRDELLRANLPLESTTKLLGAGGGDDLRHDTSPGSPLRLLDEAGADLRELHMQLRRLDPGDGLRITDASRKLRRWLADHERRVAAVLATRMPVEQAKDALRRAEPPSALAFVVDPPLEEVLTDVAEMLDPDRGDLADRLASDPAGILMELGQFVSVDDLDTAVLRLYDVDEQRYALRTRTVRWQRAIRRLAVLIRMRPSETRAGIHAHDDEVTELMKMDPDRPSQLAGTVEELFRESPQLGERILGRLDDDILGPEPDEEELHRWAADAGIDESTVARYDRALRRPLNKKAEMLRSRASELRTAQVRAAVPGHLVIPARMAPPRQATETGPEGDASVIRVAKIKVSASVDRRKREHGDEGEQWALADAVATLLDLDDEARALAIEGIRQFLERFDPSATSDLLTHASAAAASREDDEDDDLVAALENLLHVSRVSDGFGFDLVGWVAPGPDEAPRAMALEVKSTARDSFQLSSNEWRVARELREQGLGQSYAVLAVRRGKAGGVPEGMDLLADPVSLVEAGLLTLDTSSYVAKYATSER